MTPAAAPGAFGAQLRTLREAAGFTQEELATIAGLSVHAISALERGERRRPHVETSVLGGIAGRRSRPFTRSAAVPGTRPRRAATVPVDSRERANGGGNLSATRCAAAGTRTGGAVDQSADGRGSALPPA